MAPARFARQLSPLLLVLISACGGGGGQADHPPKPITQDPPEPPDTSALAPIPPAVMALHDHDPFNRSILQAYNQQLAALKAEGQPYGADFVEAPADASAGYMEDYFTYDGQHGAAAFMDGIQRPMIHSAQVPGNAMVQVYEGLYRAWDETGRRWDIPSIRRATGFFFTGSKIPPATVARNGGLWCNLFTRGPQGSLPHCVELMGKQKLEDAFNLSHYLMQTENGGFVSLTRSVNVARYFALNIGYKGSSAKEGFVYVALASAGLDATHPSLKKAWTRHEQEVAVPGLVPWDRVVAYRRILRNPGTEQHPAPPEFTGPIQVRAGLKDKDPQAYARILRELSRKSLFTRDLEEGQDWKSKVKLGNDYAHIDQFHKAHPKVDPADPSLW